MRLKYVLISIVLSGFFVVQMICASTLNTVSVSNNVNQAVVTVDCDAVPIYAIFTLHNPERIVIDFLNVSKIQDNVFPKIFNGSNLIKCIRSSITVNNQSIRIVLDLASVSTIESIIQKKIKRNYFIVLTILNKKVPVVSYVNVDTGRLSVQKQKVNNDVNQMAVINLQNRAIKRVKCDHRKKNNNLGKTPASVIIVAIDAGHGGQDPGATGRYGIYEKNVTISIAKKLKKILELDPMFKAVMIRDGDYFLSVMERSDIARKKRANVLVSIHTDSALNLNVRGASVWVLSNRRAESETIHWLRQCKEKYVELLGGLGDILTSYYREPYFNHLVLDLQFGYAQRVGYDIAVNVLHHLKDVGLLHKNIPEYSGFGVLRSPDIPSILVETGFISNNKEARLLSNNGYQEKIATALYEGLRDYFFNATTI